MSKKNKQKGRPRKIGITVKISNAKESVEVYTPNQSFEPEAADLMSKIIYDREARMKNNQTERE